MAMTFTTKINIAVFISGNGSDLQALINAQGSILSHGHIAFVLSSNATAKGVERAQTNHIPVLCLNEKEVGNDVFYATLERNLRKHDIELIVLAGYLPLLSADFTQRWQHKIINIHPSLLPKYGGKGFYGLYIHQAVLDNGDAYTGATVHYVTAQLDAGEIIAQERTAVDVHTAEELQYKVLSQIEWKLLPKTVETLCENMLANNQRHLNVAVFGAGGREHALVRKISQSPLVRSVICMPGNDGIIEAENIMIALNDSDKVLATLRERRVDLCVIGPENPLADGLADIIRAAGIPCFGPSRKAAQIEASKVFAKELMRKYHIPTAAFAVFDNYDAACDYATQCKYPIVVKADGLCGGKGVFVCDNAKEALIALDNLMIKRIFGKSGARVIIEEKLCGTEISVMVLTDAERYLLLPTAKDYKKAFDGDVGPNTGSMGAIAPHPVWTHSLETDCVQTVIEPTFRAFVQEGITYKGCLYFGLILTEQGLKVLEFNCRFGDPEAEVILPLIEEDIVPHLLACANDSIAIEPLHVSVNHCCAIVLASNGYPFNYQSGAPITPIIQNNIICAGVKETKIGYVTGGGRVACAIGIAPSANQAKQQAYETLLQIKSSGLFYRKDIG